MVRRPARTHQPDKLAGHFLERVCGRHGFGSLRPLPFRAWVFAVGEKLARGVPRTARARQRGQRIDAERQRFPLSLELELHAQIFRAVRPHLGEEAVSVPFAIGFGFRLQLAEREIGEGHRAIFPNVATA
jgi:hypothetical protein